MSYEGTKKKGVIWLFSRFRRSRLAWSSITVKRETIRIASIYLSWLFIFDSRRRCRPALRKYYSTADCLGCFRLSEMLLKTSAFWKLFSSPYHLCLSVNICRIDLNFYFSYVKDIAFLSFLFFLNFWNRSLGGPVRLKISYIRVFSYV